MNFLCLLVSFSVDSWIGSDWFRYTLPHSSIHHAGSVLRTLHATQQHNTRQHAKRIIVSFPGMESTVAYISCSAPLCFLVFLLGQLTLLVPLLLTALLTRLLPPLYSPPLISTVPHLPLLYPTVVRAFSGLGFDLGLLS